MKFSDFDKHIQQNAARNLEAPSEFDWENMDIAIPERKSRKPLFILLFSAVILASGAFYYLNSQGIEDSKTLEEQQSVVEEIATVSNQGDRIEINKNIDQKEATRRLESGKASVHVKQENVEVKEKKVNDGTTLSLEETRRDNIQHKNKTTTSTLNRNINAEIPLALQKLNDNIQLAEQISTLDYKKLSIQEQDLPQLSIFTTNKTFQPLNKGWTLLTRINHTKNFFQSSNLEYLGVLQETDVSAWSPSLSIRKVFALTPNTFATVGLSYHELHTVFSYNQYLGYEDGLNAAGSPERIHKTRVVYHNNYSRIAELNLGLGKTYPLTSQLDFQFQVGINGGYQFSDKGKTLNTSLDIVNKEFTSLSRLILSTSADAHIVYKMNQVKLLIGGGFSKFLTSTNTVDHTVLSNRPSMFFMDIGIGYQF